MAANQYIRLFPAELQFIDTATLTGAGNYFNLGLPTVFSTRIFKITNLSNVMITYALNGIPADVVPANGFVLLDVSTNRENSNILEIASGTQVTVAGATGVGLVYLSTFYAG